MPEKRIRSCSGQYSQSRKASPSEPGRIGLDAAGARSGYIPYYKYTIGNVPTPLFTVPASLFAYQLAGSGQKPASACSLRGPAETRAWLEAKLGPLAMFEGIDEAEPVSGLAGGVRAGRCTAQMRSCSRKLC